MPLNDVVKGVLESSKGSASDNVVSLKGEKLDPKKHTKYVFTYQDNRVADVKTAFKKACEYAGIPYGRKVDGGITFHTLRHTFGSWLAMKGVPMRTLQELMGHKNISMTMRYSHLAEGAKREAVQLLAGSTAPQNATVTYVSREAI